MIRKCEVYVTKFAEKRLKKLPTHVLEAYRTWGPFYSKASARSAHSLAIMMSPSRGSVWVSDRYGSAVDTG